VRNSARTRVGSPSSSRSGKRSSVCWIHSLSSRRARLAAQAEVLTAAPEGLMLVGETLTGEVELVGIGERALVAVGRDVPQPAGGRSP